MDHQTINEKPSIYWELKKNDGQSPNGDKIRGLNQKKYRVSFWVQRHHVCLVIERNCTTRVIDDYEVTQYYGNLSTNYKNGKPIINQLEFYGLYHAFMVI